MDKALAIVLILALAGCTTTRTGSLCSAGPIILDKADQLTRATAEQVIALNESGVTICHWSPP